MKKLISLLLTLAMVLSLAVPALAAEPAVTGNQSGEVSGTYNPTVAITGVSLIVDGTEHTEGLVTLNAESTVELKVYGTNLQYGSHTQMIMYEPQGTVSMNMAYGWVVSSDGTWATVSRDIINFSNITDQHTIQYSNNGEEDWLDSKVSVIYDSSKDAAINGLSVTVDGVPYTSGNVTVYSDSEVTVTVKGTNLDNANTNHAVKITPDITTFIKNWTKTETTVTMTFVAAQLSGTDSFQLQYCNDWITDETWQDTGIYLTYNEGTKPVPSYVTFNAMLKAVDSQGSEVTGVAGYLDGNRVMYSTQGTYLDTSTGTHTIGEFTVSTEGYKTPADIILTVTDDGNGNGILTTESTHASITTETIDGQTVYVITVTLEEIAEPQAKWGTSVDNLTGSGTLAEAIAAAEADSGITYIQLQSDVTTENGYDISSGVFTLDLNGKTLSSAAYTLTVRYSGTMVTLTDSATGGAVTSTGEGYAAVSPVSNGKVVFNGGSYSGEDAINFMEGGIAEIHGGTFTGTYGYAVNVAVDSTLSIAGGTFSGPWASVTTSGTTTITGGTFTAGSEGHITYMSGTLDLSGYDTEKLNGLTLSQWTGAELTVSDKNIKLPAGYVFKDSAGNTVTTLTHETVYTIAPEATVPTYTIKTSGEGGTVTADKAASAEGETVTLTVTPNENYVLYALSAYEPDNGANTVELTPGTAANTYTFLMPAHDVSVFVDFTKDGKAREDLYFNNNGNAAWTNVAAAFYTESGHYINSVNLVLAENGIYTLPKDVEIPNLAYQVYFSIGTAITATAEIPTGENNMFTLGTATNESGHYEGTWSKHTPSQPPEEVTSAEITWGSMRFTYSDEQVTLPDGTTGDKGWSTEGSDKAGTVTVANTGTTAVTVSAIYTPETAYAEITGTLGEEKTLAAAESGTFTLTLTGKPNKVLNGEKIGTVTISINPVAAPAAFTFTIDGTEYTAMTGMTWGEWLDSEYNTSASNGSDLYVAWDEEQNDKMHIYYTTIDYKYTVSRDGTYAGRVFTTDTIKDMNYTSYAYFI